MKWEYKILELDSRSGNESYLDELGTDGWELVAVTQYTYSVTVYLKRICK